MTLYNLSSSLLSAPIVLQVQHLNKQVSGPEGQLSILDDISLTIYRSEAVAIVGRSGSGKTTLLGLLAGLDLPTSGSILLENQEITQLDEEARAVVRAKHVGFVFQNFQLLPSMTALENVMLPLELAQASNAQERAITALERVELGNRLQHYPNTLSGGEQQRVAIARAFAGQPAILFADEPTGNLDERTGESISDLLFTLNEQYGATLIMVTHDQRLADRCQRVFQIDYGRLIDSYSQNTENL